MEKVYLEKLSELEALSASIKNTRMSAIAKMHAFIALNMRYEKLQINRNLSEHPYILVDRLVDDAIKDLKAWQEISFIEEDDTDISVSSRSMEDMHNSLFQNLWTQFDLDGYKSRIKRFEHRLNVNNINGEVLRGKRVIDFGCGHGNFDHSFLNCGADFVLGVDYGSDSISYAKAAQKELGVSEERLRFKEASVYDTGEADESFDVAVQNGVFHHLDDEDRAYREVFRVLKPGGLFWVYTDGEGGISYDLWDTCRRALTNVPHSLLMEYTEFLNIGEGKRYHIGDGLNAVYRHTSWDEITTRLSELGFESFQRLIGGFDTDLDLDIIESDRWGKEKFGGGDLRILCQKKK